MAQLFLDGTGARMRSGAIWTLRFGVQIGVALGVLELLLQVTTSSYSGQVYDHAYTGGFPLEIQEAGNRGPSVAPTKSTGEFRVLALGDSTTFGTGIAAGDTYPLRLADRLATEGRQAVGINAGVPGSALDELTRSYREQWADYSPDLVVLALSGNIVSYGWIRRDQPPAVADGRRRQALAAVNGWSERRAQLMRQLRQLCLPSFFARNMESLMFWTGLSHHRIDPQTPRGPMLAHGWLQGDVDQVDVDLAWALLESDLGIFAAAVRASGAEILVTHLPARFVLSDQVRDNQKRVPLARLMVDPCGRTAEICARLGLRYVDAQGALMARRSESPELPLYIPFDFQHLDPDGHEVLAKAIHSAAAEKR